MPSTQPDATTKGGNGLIRVISGLNILFLKELIYRGGVSKGPFY